MCCCCVRSLPYARAHARSRTRVPSVVLLAAELRSFCLVSFYTPPPAIAKVSKVRLYIVITPTTLFGAKFASLYI